MAPTYFPLRWESTRDQWWYASPIDWAAANGHYDLVRELLKIDNNHLIKLTSLRRIRRLETVWDDDEKFHDVAKCRSQVARRLFQECESKRGKKNSLLRGGYGGWLMYTAASAGDLGFIKELLERDPLLVFGEGEFGVTDVLYAAARSKSCEVFKVVFDFAVSPRLSTGKGGELEEHIGEIPSLYRWEMMNRAAHAAARGGNLRILKELLSNCSDVLAYRDALGSTILHAAASKGQVEVVKYLTESFDIGNSTDHQGNTALNIAALKGQLTTVQALIAASPSSVSIRNAAGETFLHMAISGFQTPGFRRLDRQMELMKQLVHGNALEDIINAKNNDGRTALHMAIIGNVHSELIELLMTVRSIDVNGRDEDGMTALDLLKQRPHSVSSDILIRQLISAGGMFGARDFTARKAIASHLKMQVNGSSPGTSFRIVDSEIFLHTGIENALDANDLAIPGIVSSSFDSTNENDSSFICKKPGTANSAAQRLRKVLMWPRNKEKNTERGKRSGDGGSGNCSSDETPVPLRQRFSKPTSLPNNKRTLSVRSNISSPSNRKKLASGLRDGVLQAVPNVNLPHRSRSSSFSKSPLSSPNSVNNYKQKGVYAEHEIAGPSCSKEVITDGSPNTKDKGGSFRKKFRGQYFCFGTSSLSPRTPVTRRQCQNQAYKCPVPSVA